MKLIRLVLAILCVPVWSQTVTIPAEVTVAHDQFKLGDIATISGDDDQLASIVLGMSPRPGLHRSFTRGQVLTKLRQFGFTNRHVTLEMPDTIVITRASQPVSADSIIAAAKERLRASCPDTADDMTLLSSPIPKPVEPGTITFEADPVVGRSGTQYTVTVRARQAGVTRGTYRVAFRLERAKLPNAVKSGDPITVTVDGPGIQVSVVGEARSAGAVGDTISVYIPATKKTMKAVVTSERSATLKEGLE